MAVFLDILPTPPDHKPLFAAVGAAVLRRLNIHRYLLIF
jgi:hypothetical protein